MNKPIIFIDSGIGGLPYCKDFLEKNPREEVYYIADKQHFPLGPRNKEEVEAIMIRLTEKIIKKFFPKIIVLACNTATVSALEPLRLRFSDVIFVGTVPAIKPAALSTKTGIIGVLGTERTIEDPINQQIADSVKDGLRIFSVAAADLVEFVEHHIETADEKQKTDIVNKYINIFVNEGADAVVLGCTHFLHLLDIFKREADHRGSIAIYESLDGIVKRIEFLLDENNSAKRAKNNVIPERRLFITGSEPAGYLWQKFSKDHNFILSRL
ncbi:MAG: glutamate racemase [Treponema sp.]|nr:glutamate racemase [Treponema sp.]